MPKNPLGLVQRDEVTIVRIGANRVVDQPDVDDMCQSLLQLADDPGRVRLLLDFANVKSVSVAVIPTLVLLRKRLLARDGDLAMCGLDCGVRELIAFANQQQPFNVHNTERDALLSFGQGGKPWSD